MVLQARFHAALALVAGCLPTYDAGSGTTAAMTSGTPSFGDLPPPDDGEPTTTAPELTSSTSTTGGTSTTADPTMTAGPVCGDGNLDPGEDCDLGPDNANDGACTLMCDPAVCGDGLLWAGHEECDFGDGNVGGHGGCNPDCTLAPYCGDGKVDAVAEECDLGALNGTGVGLENDAPCGLTCRWQGRLVFTTSVLYDGSLGGLPGADLKCRNLAVAAGIDNASTFRAWLSDGLTSPLTNFEQIDLAGAPYILRSGRIVADDFTELVEQGPRTGIAVDETGAYVPRSSAPQAAVIGWCDVAHRPAARGVRVRLQRTGAGELRVGAGSLDDLGHVDDRHLVDYDAEYRDLDLRLDGQRRGRLRLRRDGLDVDDGHLDHEHGQQRRAGHEHRRAGLVRRRRGRGRRGVR